MGNILHKAIFTVFLLTANVAVGDTVQPISYSNRTFDGPALVPQNINLPTIDVFPQNDAFGRGFPAGSTRWSGSFTPQFSEDYTLFTITRDGIRLYVDGILVIDSPDALGPVVNGLPSPINRQTTVSLQANRPVSFIFEIFNNGTPSRFTEAHLYWQSPSQPTELIPVCALPEFGITFPPNGTSFGTDPDETSIPNESDIDLLELFIDDRQSEFLTFETIHITATRDPSTAFNIFIDSIPGQGFPVYSLQADFLIQGLQLLRYRNGQWEPFRRLNVTSGSLSFSQVDLRRSFRLSLDRDWIGNPESFDFLFYGNNPGTGGVGIDVFPDNAGSGNLLTWTRNPANGFVFDGQLADWAEYGSRFDRDPIDQPNNALIDFRQLLVGNTADQYFLGYWNQRDIIWNEGYLLFVDTNRNLNTGYPVYGRKAEFLIRDQKVFRYTGGTSGAWSWEFIGNAEQRFSDNTAELRFPKSWFGNQTTNTRIEFKFYGDNGATGSDTYPDGGTWLEYRLR